MNRGKILAALASRPIRLRYQTSLLPPAEILRPSVLVVVLFPRRVHRRPH
jgi:hypothetical protein